MTLLILIINMLKDYSDYVSLLSLFNNCYYTE